MNQQRLIQIALAVFALVAAALFLPREGEQEAVPASLHTTHAEAPSTKPVPAAPVEANSDASGGEGDFDYYVLVLSWSPTHCASEDGRGRDDDLQCRGGRPFGFVLHGLWPQYERGYPQDCPSDEPRTVADGLMAKMLEITPSEKLVQHEWSKHGTCSGLSQSAYFARAEKAFGDVAVPLSYFKLKEALQTTADDVRDAFIRSNPRWPSNAVAATCRRGELSEVWVCLDKTLGPRACSKDVSTRHCGERRVRMRAVRGNWPR